MNHSNVENSTVNNAANSVENKSELNEASKPWYKQFWLWFLIFFPALAVVAGTITIVIAFKNEDSLVRDDYYKAGLAINSRLILDSAAIKKNIHARLTIDPLIGELQLTLSGDLATAPEQLILDFIHPTHQPKDFSLTLKHSHDFRYIGQLQQALRYRWHLQLSDSEPKNWRLKTTAHFDQSPTDTSIHSAPAPVLIKFSP